MFPGSIERDQWHEDGLIFFGQILPGRIHY